MFSTVSFSNFTLWRSALLLLLEVPEVGPQVFDKYQHTVLAANN